MDKDEISQLAEEMAKKYNPQGLSPFPFEAIQRDRGDLEFGLVAEDVLGIGASGGIMFNKEKSKFLIFVNKDKPLNRQYFTTAHELGHYFLHGDIVKREEAIIDKESPLDGQRMLYRLDEAESIKIEFVANNFAASLIMPERLVYVVWDKLRNIEECAKIFRVSVAAMAVRLERLKLV